MVAYWIREMGLVSKAVNSGIHVNQTAEDRGNPSLLLSKWTSVLLNNFVNLHFFRSSAAPADITAIRASLVCLYIRNWQVL